MRKYRIGDRVVFRVTKCGTCPGQHAYHTSPSPRGEFYTYHVDKYWRVIDVGHDGMLRVVTRRGKVHSLDAADASLRAARWRERLFRAGRFPQMPAVNNFSTDHPRPEQTVV